MWKDLIGHVKRHYRMHALVSGVLGIALIRIWLLGPLLIIYACVLMLVMHRCPKCNRPLPLFGSACRYCGREFGSSEPKVINKPLKRSKRV